MFVLYFEILVQVVPEKSLTENFVREKEKWKIKGLISHMWLILQYTVRIAISDVCTKFQSPRSNSS